MMSQKLLAFSILFLLSIPLHAQYNFYGVPQSLANDPGQAIQGAGIVPLSQGCQFGAQQAAATIDDDEDVKQARDDLKEARGLNKDAAKAWKEASRELNVQRRAVAKAMNGTTVDLIAEATKCQSVFGDPLYQGSPDDKKQTYFLTKYPAYPSPGNDKITANADPNGPFPAGAAEASRCSKALEATKFAGLNVLDASALCVYPDGLSPESPYRAGMLSKVPDAKAETACRDATKKLAKLIKAEADAKVNFDRAKEAMKLAADNLKETRKTRKAEIAADRKFNKENGITDDDDEDAGDGGVRGCTTGTCGIRVVERKKSTFETMVPLLQTLIQVGVPAAVNVSNARRNASLGYPTGPNPWLPTIGQIGGGLASNMYGYPMSYGGSYGGVMGGVGAGAFGCGQTIGAAQGFPVQPMYGNGQMYTPGYIPGVGYAGPGFMGGGNQVNPFNSFMQPGALGAGQFPMNNPYAMYGNGGQFGAQAGFYAGAGGGSPYGFNGAQFGAQAGLYAGAGGGSPYALNGGFPGSQFGLGANVGNWGGAGFGGSQNGWNNGGGSFYSQQDDYQRMQMASRMYTSGQQLQYQGLSAVYGGSASASPIGQSYSPYSLTSPTAFPGR